MTVKIALRVAAAGFLFLGSATLASAHGQHQRHYRHHVYAQNGRTAGPARILPDAMPAYQAYAGYRGPYAYGGVPEDPLIPLKAEVPPPVDPNEPGSGSYGAMLEGRNPAPSEP
jgi:hypothetical protein